MELSQWKPCITNICKSKFTKRILFQLNIIMSSEFHLFYCSCLRKVSYFGWTKALNNNPKFVFPVLSTPRTQMLFSSMKQWWWWWWWALIALLPRHYLYIITNLIQTTPALLGSLLRWMRIRALGVCTVCFQIVERAVAHVPLSATRKSRISLMNVL